MTINSSKVAIGEALKTTRNVLGTCQMVTRGWYNAPSAGDVDGDGDADAKDGWLSEPVKYRHPGDRNPPPGVPLYFEKDGGRGFGHRCMTLAHAGRLRSTDMFDNHYSPTNTSTVTGPTTSAAIAVIERAMGLVYVGWSESMDGSPIPGVADIPTKPVPAPKPPKEPVKNGTRGPRIDDAIDNLKTSKAKPGSDRAKFITRALRALRLIPQHKKH